MSRGRYSRQEDIVPANKLQETNITIAGVGSVGRNVALQLASVGAPKLQIIDFDIVEESNIASQGFLEKDLGNLKVDAVANFCENINKEILIEKHPFRFRRSQKVGNIFFCLVDNIETRAFIWEAVKDKVDLYIDTRMAAEALRVITITKETKDYYPKTLFPQAETHQGACTAKSTIYCGNLIAALAVASFTKYLREIPLDKDISFNILTTELMVDPLEN